MADEIYDSWKRDRAKTEVPAGFAGRVMARIAERETQRQTFAAWLVVTALPRLGRGALCLVAALLGLARMGQALGSLIP